MKRFVLGMTALVSAVSMNAKDDIDSLLSVELQGVQVVSTRASKKTPVAYTNMSQKELKATVSAIPRSECVVLIRAASISRLTVSQ